MEGNKAVGHRCDRVRDQMLPCFQGQFDISLFCFFFFWTLASSRPCSLCPWRTHGCAPGEPSWSTPWVATPAWGRWTWAGTTWTTSEPRCWAKPCRSTPPSGEGEEPSFSFRVQLYGVLHLLKSHHFAPQERDMGSQQHLRSRISGCGSGTWTVKNHHSHAISKSSNLECSQ